MKRGVLFRKSATPPGMNSPLKSPISETPEKLNEASEKSLSLIDFGIWRFFCIFAD